jgi:peptide/nickel transport system substrate-binding protein
MNICFNMNTTDEMRRAIFRNKDFRIGMSLGINRKEIIEIVQLSQEGAIPHQTAPRTDSHLYHKKLATQYTEYDTKKAAEYLDKVLPNKDAQGRRLGPDGKPFSFVMEIDASRTTYVDALELIKPQWAKLGVEMIIKTMERSLWEERCRARNLEFHASAHRFGGGSGLEVTLDPRYFFPQNTGNSLFAKAWAFWYVDPKAKDAEEPPAAAKKQMELYNTVLVTADPKKQDELMTQILDIAAEEFYSIGTVQEPDFFCVVTDRLKNVPKSMPNSSQYGTPNPTEPSQYFIDESA